MRNGQVGGRGKGGAPREPEREKGSRKTFIKATHLLAAKTARRLFCRHSLPCDPRLLWAGHRPGRLPRTQAQFMATAAISRNSCIVFLGATTREVVPHIFDKWNASVLSEHEVYQPTRGIRSRRGQIPDASFLQRNSLF